MMSSGSLKLRLFSAAALAISVSLIIAGLSFYFIFQRYVERQAISELQNHYVQLIASIRVDDSGKMKARTTLSDPRFQKPYGGLYWQINEDAQIPLRSRSLFDDTLDIKKFEDAAHAGDLVHIISGPHSTSLFAIEHALFLPVTDSTDRQLHIIMAIDRKDIDDAVQGFGRDLMLGLGLLYLVLVSASFVQIVVGLRPLEAIRRGVEAMREGKVSKINGVFPSEVHALVQEVNALISERAERLERARQRASNLAHGLKTPLTVMSTLAQKIDAAGLKSEARDIQEGADQMRMLVERELARARMASGNAAQLTSIAPTVTRMVAALKKTAENDALLWHSNIPAHAKIAMEPADLLELVGNLLDNARKWAKDQIYVSWVEGTIIIEDDGAGVPDDQLEAIQERGIRLDEKISGSGLGLGIVRDLCEVYNFDLKFKRSSLGGLSVLVDTKSQPLRIERPA
jgi:signal transduction histidine kinase